MTPPLPFTIKRSYVGIILMIVAWFAVNVLLYYGLAYSGVDGETQETMVFLAGFVTVLTGLVLLYSVFMYLSSSMTFTEEGVEVVRYPWLFKSETITIEWSNVEVLTVTSSGVLKLLGDIGTVRVETASPGRNPSLNWVGDISQVREIAAQLAAVND